MPQLLVCVIDDDESVRIALGGLMRALGHKVCIYSSAADFLQSGTWESCACIITDIQMPGLSGIDLKRKLDEGTCRAPVIMITGHPSPQLDKEARAIGAFCVLKKPFEPSALIKCIDRALAA